MPARLNRRRYREVVAALKGVLVDPKTSAKQKLQAADTLLEVYRRHDDTERRKEALKQRTEGPATPETSEPVPAEPKSREDAERAAREFLDQMKEKYGETANG